ncbi:MAG TPA: hypothetical protein VFF33_08750 [Ignavibacteriaceae bacterium]|nr:hypothetical protein [Ignavibacteriaceae bacterium]
MDFKNHKYYKFIYDTDINLKLSKANHFCDVFNIFDDINLEVLVTSILIIDPYFLFDSPVRYSEDEYELIVKFILMYPELKIFFYTSENNLDFLITYIKSKYESSTDKRNIDLKFNTPELKYNHIFSLQSIQESFELAISGKSNMFDFSGIRTVLKNCLLEDIKAAKDNFKELHTKRESYIAFTIDEESKQAYFNAYTLYRYGFRVMPVISFRQLSNLRIQGYIFQNKDTPKLIIRDWDLQFEDYDYNSPDSKVLKTSSSESVRSPELLSQLRELCFNKAKNQWSQIDEIWKSFPNSRYYFITRCFNENDKNFNTPHCDLNPSFTEHYILENNKSRCTLRGLVKPIEGMSQFLKILGSFYNSIGKDEYRNFYRKFFLDETPMDSTRKQTNAEKLVYDQIGGHAISPKVLSLAETLINRSQAYYEQNYFMTAALLSQEALELLNGFHFLEMLRALYLRTISETQLEVELIGASDDPDLVHIKFRELKSLAKRICWNNDEAYRNLLNQLAIDLRHIYMDKELLESADACLREYVQNASGKNITDFFPEYLKKYFIDF